MGSLEACLDQRGFYKKKKHPNIIAQIVEMIVFSLKIPSTVVVDH